ncbi:hypothetical protein GCM10027036_30650 [Flavihumibacter cheonanensis]
MPLLAQDSLKLSERVPVVTGISPVAGPIGTIVTIQGKNFSPVPAENFVRMGGIVCPVLSATSTELTIRIPIGMNSQRLVVMSKDGLITMTDYIFKVTFESLGKTLGKRSVQLARSYTAAGNPYSVVTADLNNDGVLDVFALQGVQNFYAGLLLARDKNNKKLGYEIIKRLENNKGGYSTTGDLDGDGVEEILVNTGLIQILQNKSNPDSFDYNLIANISHSVFSFYDTVHRLMDLNADGKPDLVCRIIRGLILFENNSTYGEPSFKKGIIKMIGDQSDRNYVLLNGDLDGDGKQEIIMNGGENNDSIYIVRNLHEQGQLLDPNRLEIAQRFSISMQPNVVGNIEDIDGDGKLDLYFLGSKDSMLTVFRNRSENGSFLFEKPAQLSIKSYNYESIFADIDGDGRRDLVFSRNPQYDPPATAFSSYYMKNTSNPGNIQFDPPVGLNLNGSLITVFDGDLDENGTPDLIFGNISPGQVQIVKNTSNDAGVKVAPDSPPAGYIDQSMFLDDSIRTHNNAPFVRRHYEINPEQNGSTVKATITLYFTQQDFTEFNAYRPDDQNLPTGPEDTIGKANLRVYKYGGLSIGSHHPSEYTGEGIEINPDDNKIVWNDIEELWEVSFDVTGFSGFFVAPQNDAMIAKPQAPAVPVIVAKPAQEVCSGTSIRLVASSAGCTDCTYSWNTNPVTVDSVVTVTSSGTYTVSATNKVGTATASLQVQVFQTPPKPEITVQSNLLTSSAVTGNQWYFNGQAITGATQQKLTVFESGTYAVQVKAGACTSELSETKQVVITSIDQLELQGGISIHPNPVQSSLFIKNSQLLQLSISVFDLSGKRITSIRTNRTSNRIDLQQLRSGIYILQLFDERNDRFFIRKFVKE